MERPISELHVNCSYEMVMDAKAASDTCQAPANSAVVMETGVLMWRCSQHRGLRRPLADGDVEIGEVRWATTDKREPVPWTRGLPDEVLEDLERITISVWNLYGHQMAIPVVYREAAMRVREAVESEQADREDKQVNARR